MSKVTLEQAECIIKKYMDSEIVLKKDFFNHYGINGSTRAAIIAAVRNGNPKLHSKYVNMKKKSHEVGQTKEEKMEKLDKIIDGIIFGIDGRKFDLIDYYTITKMDFSELISLFLESNYGEIEKSYIKEFVLKNTLKNEAKYWVYKKQELESKIIIKNYEVSSEDKCQAFDILDNLELPYHRKLYNLAVRKVIREKEENKKYCKTKNNSI